MGQNFRFSELFGFLELRMRACGPLSLFLPHVPLWLTSRYVYPVNNTWDFFGGWWGGASTDVKEESTSSCKTHPAQLPHFNSRNFLGAGLKKLQKTVKKKSY